MADQDFDRSEQATPFKLQKARERGQVARSTDTVASAVFLCAMLYLCWHGADTVRQLLQLARVPLATAAAADTGIAGSWNLPAQMATHAARVLLPLLLLLPAAALLATIGQRGAVLSFTPLQIDFERIHPGAGLKRMFSLRTLFEGARACIKLVVLVIVAALALRDLLPQFRGIAALSGAAFLQLLLDDVATLGLKMAAALVGIALLDLLYTRHDFARRMRMSRRELKDEYRNREGDPRIRARLRELRREMLRRSLALKNTKTADVVLTNPTHYAVALRYVHGEMEAPRVVAKGAGQVAAAMREIAARHRIVVVQNPPLARRLFRETAIDEYLPAGFHAEVARIIVWVLAMRQQRAAAAGART